MSGRALESRRARHCDARGSAEEPQAPESGGWGETERFAAPAARVEEKEGGRAVVVAGSSGRPPGLAGQAQWRCQVALVTRAASPAFPPRRAAWAGSGRLCAAVPACRASCRTGRWVQRAAGPRTLGQRVPRAAEL